MVIRRGEEWGHPIERAPSLRTAATDAQLVDLLRTDRVTPITVRGGDVFSSLGAPPERSTMQRVSFDLLHVQLDGEPMLAVANVIAVRSWWWGELRAACNVSQRGPWNAAPRAHPNDGRVDVIEVSKKMGLRARWQARQRLPTGSHIPHPDIDVGRATHVAWRFDRPCPLIVDGRDPVLASTVRIEVEPDAFELDI